MEGMSVVDYQKKGAGCEGKGGNPQRGGPSVFKGISSDLREEGQHQVEERRTKGRKGSVLFGDRLNIEEGIRHLKVRDKKGREGRVTVERVRRKDYCGFE